MPYRLADGRTGVATAQHVAGQIGWQWTLTDSEGRRSGASTIAVSEPSDVALLAPDSGPWSSSLPVMLSDDYSATFQARAKSLADVQPGDRVCRTGWSSLSRDGRGYRVANGITPPDIPSAGTGVICGRVSSTSTTNIWISNSDRPDGLIAGTGDSGGAVWKAAEDGSFIFIGIIRGATTDVSEPGYVYGKNAVVKPAWLIESSLSATPMLANQRPFLTISPSTYYPTDQGPVTLRGSFRDKNGDPIANKPLDVIQDYPGNFMASTRTDSNGNYSVTVGTPRRGAAFAVRFGGDDSTPAVASRFIGVWSTVATIVDPPSTATAGTQTTIRARATSSSGIPIVGRTVRVQLYANAATNDFTVPITGTTDDDGYVNLTFTAPSADIRYAVRLMEDPSTNGSPVGAAASAIYPLTVK